MRLGLRNIIDVLFPRTITGSNLPSGYAALSGCIEETSTMKISAVYRAVKLISEGVARLTLALQRYNSARNCYVDDYSSPLYVALRVRPNGDMSAFDMWRAAVQQMLLLGNAYILPTRRQQEVVSLTLLSPHCVSYDIATKMYIVNDPLNGVKDTYSSADIVHLRNVGTDGGHTGISTVQQAAYSLGILRMADQNTASTLTEGGRIKGIITGSTGSLFADASTQQLAEVGARIERDIRDGKGIIPVSGDMKFQPITLSPADAKVLESKQFTIRDIARYFCVHPDLLYEGSNNTYKAAEVPNVMFLTQTLEPLLTQIENELLIKLIPSTIWGRRRIRFDREAMYTTDLQTEAVYYEKMLQTGIYTVNELRLKKGQAPIEGGDTPLVSANLKGLDAVLAEGQINVNNEKL